MKASLRHSFSLLSATVLFSCTGVLGEAYSDQTTSGPTAGAAGVPNPPPSAPADPVTSDPIAPPVNPPSDPALDPPLNCFTTPSPIRRLTRLEYTNTVESLLGVSVDTTQFLAPDSQLAGFHVNTLTVVDELVAQQFSDLATEVASQAMNNPGAFLPCELADLDDTCATEAINTLVAGAFRTPADSDTFDEVWAVYAWGRDTYDPATGLETVLIALLQQPDFLYRYDLPGGDDTDIALASRLAYMLWQSPPDAELVTLAESGLLSDPQELEAQARRMIEDPKARATLVDFYLQWLGLDELAAGSKDATLYPVFDEATIAAMIAETEAFVDHVMWNEGGSLESLLSAPFTFTEPELAGYGAGRAGLLTQPSWLAAHAHGNRSSPTLRGLWIRENVLCQTLPDPPTDIEFPEFDPDLTSREFSEGIMANATCAACHRLMDPVGFHLESFDAVGQWRDGADTTGTLTGTDDIDGDYDGAVELTDQLADSDQVRWCMTRQWMRYATGRLDTAADQCSLNQAYEAFRNSNWDVRELAVATALTEAFTLLEEP